MTTLRSFVQSPVAMKAEQRSGGLIRPRCEVPSSCWKPVLGSQ